MRKNLKTTHCLTLLLTLVFALCAWGSAASEPSSTVIVPSAAEPDTQTEPGVDAVGSEKPEKKASFGSIAAGINEKTYFGICYDFDEDWYILSDEELAEFVGLTNDEFRKADIEKIDGSTFDLYAVSNDGLCTIHIALEKLNMIDTVKLLESDYLYKSLELLDDVLAESGLENYAISRDEKEIAGAFHPVVRIKGNIEDVEAYEIIAPIKVDKYVADLSVVSYTDDITDALMDSFYAVE